MSLTSVSTMSMISETIRTASAASPAAIGAARSTCIGIDRAPSCGSPSGAA